ncbi:MAG: hypothetical protein K2G90_04495 [Muribaculaceae bacterium]|nr:hypothetical protein [Muribaculaceae bacterium]MDE6008448.1 hypothetical protein [Muribaculaceae bacterium]
MEKTVNFRIADITTSQFAIFESDFNPGIGEVEMDSNYSYGIIPEQRLFISTLSISFYQKEKVIIKIETNLAFELDEQSFASFIKGDKFIMETDKLRVFTSLLYGATRGILAAKLENTPLKTVILPLVDIDTITTYPLEINLTQNG